MKRLFMLLVILFAGVVPVMAAMTGTYVDVTSSNTVAVDGTDPWYSATKTNGLWFERGFGNPGTASAPIYEIRSGAFSGADLKTTIDGLTPGQNYDVRVIHWSKSSAENWQVLSGVSAEKTEAVLCDFLTGTQTSVQILGSVYEMEELVGTATADASGSITAYTFDTLGGQRSWLDGYTYDDAYLAYNPSPATGAENVTQSSSLTWSAMQDPDNPSQENPNLVDHKVYFSNDPNLDESTLIATIAKGGTLEVTPSLDANEVYYWRVDEVTNIETITGATWSFATVKTLPVFESPLGSQPENTRAFPGESPTFTAVAGTTGGLGGTINYQWYKGQPGDTSNPVSGAISSELALTSVTTVDEGYYFCRATNDVGSADSQAASLLVKRLLSLYGFEDNLLDSEGGIDGTMIDPLADPNFADSLSGLGQAIEISGVAVDLGTDAYPKAGLGNGLESGSVSLWFNTPSIGFSFAGVYNGESGDFITSYDIGWSTGNSMSALVRDDNNTSFQPDMLPSGSLVNAWHLLSVTWDNANGQSSLYVDGILARQETDGMPVDYSDWTHSMILGARNNRGTIDNIYTGLMDDYRVYNYPLNAFEVAKLYTDIKSDESICVEYSVFDVSGPDGEPDCKVDLYDFTEFAADWLKCNLLPVSDCD